MYSYEAFCKRIRDDIRTVDEARNSTINFLIFTKQNGEDGIEVRVHDEDVWLTQKSIEQLLDCSTDNI